MLSGELRYEVISIRGARNEERKTCIRVISQLLWHAKRQVFERAKHLYLGGVIERSVPVFLFLTPNVGEALDFTSYGEWYRIYVIPNYIEMSDHPLKPTVERIRSFDIPGYGIALKFPVKAKKGIQSIPVWYVQPNLWTTNIDIALRFQEEIQAQRVLQGKEPIELVQPELPRLFRRFMKM